jgi:hypothetical protein
MIEKETFLKALSAVTICLALGTLCALAPHQQPLMKSFFAFASLIFLGISALAIPLMRKHSLYWSMLALWSGLQAFMLFAWVVHFPVVTAIAWAVTPLAYTTIACLIVAAIHKSTLLTPRQRMLFIMSLFLGGMHLLLGDTSVMKSVIVYFIALMVFPVNVYELFHEPSEAGSRLGHKITTTLLGITLTFYLLDSIGTIILSIDGLRFLSMYQFFEGARTIAPTTIEASYPFVAATLAYSGIFASIFLLIYLVWAVLPRACSARQSHEDIF